MNDHGRYNSISRQRASPWAILGAFGLIGVAVFFGVFGPQISDRGNLILGSTLSDLLPGTVHLYEIESREMRYVRNDELESVPASEIEGELLRRFDDRADYFDLESAGFVPVLLDSKVQLTQIPEGLQALSVVYVDRLGGLTAGGPAILVYIEDQQHRIAHDRFGIPMRMVPGVVYRFQINGSQLGQHVWSASWYEGSILHVLMADSVDTLDLLLEAARQDDDDPEAEPGIALGISGSRLDPAPSPGRLI
jgi:hypothetical protein